jgi:hypothetical protein
VNCRKFKFVGFFTLIDCAALFEVLWLAGSDQSLSELGGLLNVVLD